MSGAFSPPRKITANDDLTGFSCSVAAIDEWVASYASCAERRGTAVVYGVFCEGHLAGIYSLSSHWVARADVRGGWLRRNAPECIPVILLGMLGVHGEYQGQGLGSSLLGDALRRAVRASEQIGAKALLVDPANEKAAAFYRAYGFREIPGMTRMFVSLKRR